MNRTCRKLTNATQPATTPSLKNYIQTPQALTTPNLLHNYATALTIGTGARQQQMQKEGVSTKLYPVVFAPIRCRPYNRSFSSRHDICQIFYTSKPLCSASSHFTDMSLKFKVQIPIQSQHGAQIRR